MSKKRNPEETREKILDVSLELFRTKSYEKTTILDIVDAMNASRGAFYHHFKSKEEVLWAMLERKEISDWDNYFENLLADNTLNGIEKLRKIFTRSIELSFSGEDAHLTTSLLSLMNDPKMLSEQVKALQETKWLQPIVEQGMSDGTIRQNDKHCLIQLLLLLLSFWLYPTIYPGDSEYIKTKILMVKKVLDELGCPLLDEEFLELLTKVINNAKSCKINTCT